MGRRMKMPPRNKPDYIEDAQTDMKASEGFSYFSSLFLTAYSIQMRIVPFG
jgi:hypothetical protein